MVNVPALFNVIVPLLTPPPLRGKVTAAVDVKSPVLLIVTAPVKVFVPVALLSLSVPEMEVVPLTVKFCVPSASDLLALMVKLFAEAAAASVTGPSITTLLAEVGTTPPIHVPAVPHAPPIAVLVMVVCPKAKLHETSKNTMSDTILNRLCSLMGNSGRLCLLKVKVAFI
jgi:hypothetical protein